MGGVCSLSLRRSLGSSSVRLAEEEGRRGEGVTLDEVKRIDGGEDGITLSMTISTSDVDRDGDTIAVEVGI